MPPAALMSSMASCPAFRMALPGSAYGPEKGPVIPTLIGEPGLFEFDVPHAASSSAPHVARLAIRNRRLTIGCALPPVLPKPCLGPVDPPQTLPAAFFPAAGARVRRRQTTYSFVRHGQYRHPSRACQPSCSSRRARGRRSPPCRPDLGRSPCCLSG